MSNKIEIKVGQVYIEDRGAGKSPNRFDISLVGESCIEYRTVLSSHQMPRHRFEGLIRSGVFTLLEVDPARVEIPPTQFDRQLESLKENIKVLRWKNDTLRASTTEALDSAKADLKSAITARDYWWNREGERTKQRDEVRKECEELKAKSPVSLQVGQFYVETRSTGPVEREIISFDGEMMVYRTDELGEHQWADGRRGCSVKVFEALVRAGVVNLKPTAPEFQKDDVWVCRVSGVRVVDEYNSTTDQVRYRHRTLLNSVQENNITPKGFRMNIIDSCLMRGRLTDYHCVCCGQTCRGDGTRHWCVNPKCEQVGQVNPSTAGKSRL